jgi:hypothetical protein
MTCLFPRRPPVNHPLVSRHHPGVAGCTGSGAARLRELSSENSPIAEVKETGLDSTTTTSRFSFAAALEAAAPLGS